MCYTRIRQAALKEGKTYLKIVRVTPEGKIFSLYTAVPLRVGAWQRARNVRCTRFQDLLNCSHDYRRRFKGFGAYPDTPLNLDKLTLQAAAFNSAAVARVMLRGETRKAKCGVFWDLFLSGAAVIGNQQKIVEIL